MSYYEYRATPAALQALCEWHKKHMRGYSPDDVAGAHCADLRALEDGEAVEIRGTETFSGVPEVFRLDREDSKYFTKSQVIEDED